MAKTSIVIIILCTVLMAAVIYFTLRQEPGIEDIYLVDSSNVGKEPLVDRGDTEFPGLDS